MIQVLQKWYYMAEKSTGEEDWIIYASCCFWDGSFGRRTWPVVRFLRSSAIQEKRQMMFWVDIALPLIQITAVTSSRWTWNGTLGMNVDSSFKAQLKRKTWIARRNTKSHGILNINSPWCLHRQILVVLRTTHRLVCFDNQVRERWLHCATHAQNWEHHHLALFADWTSKRNGSERGKNITDCYQNLVQIELPDASNGTKVWACDLDILGHHWSILNAGKLACRWLWRPQSPFSSLYWVLHIVYCYY